MSEDTLTFSGDMRRWAELIGKLLLEFERKGWIIVARETIEREMTGQDTKPKERTGDIEIVLTLRGPPHGKGGFDHVDFVKKLMVLAKMHCSMELVDTNVHAI
jgi:hypothetical protein